jgi:CheY-like chemotaxis protein
VAEVLSQWGCRAECASSALAVERMSEAQCSGDPFRMMIAGQRMGEHEAESLAQAVRADPQLRGTIMVMVSANPSPQGCRESLAAGFTEYVENPSGISSIYEGLVRAWREVGSGRPVPALPPAPEVPTSDPARMSVLLLDDNAADRGALAKILEELGCQTEIAADGRQALEMWATRFYDLILVDCQMPGMDAYEVTTEIRGLERLGARDPNRPSHTPIVALLDGGAGVSRMKCIALGMDDCLTKPLSHQLLKSKLNKFAPVLVPVRR